MFWFLRGGVDGGVVDDVGIGGGRVVGGEG